MRKIDVINGIDIRVRDYAGMLFIVFTIFLAGCSDNSAALPAASFGDVTVLEKLAKSYEKVAERFPMSPQKLRLKDKKEFVEDVFSDAGYSYKKTLLSSATQSVIKSKHHRDLVELVLMPAMGVDEESLTELYDEDELLVIVALKSGTKK